MAGHATAGHVAAGGGKPPPAKRARSPPAGGSGPSAGRGRGRGSGHGGGRGAGQNELPRSPDAGQGFMGRGGGQPDLRPSPGFASGVPPRHGVASPVPPRGAGPIAGGSRPPSAAAGRGRSAGPGPRPFSEGDAHRRSFDKLMKDASAVMREGDARRFFQAMLSYEDKLDLLYRLSSPQEHGAARLRAALVDDDSAAPAFLNDCVVPFLALLGSPELVRGTCKKPLAIVLEALYRVPGFLPNLQDEIAAGMIRPLEPIAWFLLSVATTLPEARTSHTAQAVSGLLQQAAAAAGSGGGAEQLPSARQLDVVLQSTAAAEASAGTEAEDAGAGADPLPAGTAAAALRPIGGSAAAAAGVASGPGGRHDNDFADYRSIKLLPTIAEAACMLPAYLPQRHEPAGDASEQGIAAEDASGELEAAARQGAEARAEAALLGRQFRLLREDVLAPLREELQAVQAALGKPAALAASRAKVFEDVAIAAVASGAAPPLPARGWRTKPAVLIAFAPPQRARGLRTYAHRKDYWEGVGRGMLPLDALVCLVRAGQPVCLATVVRRELKELAREDMQGNRSAWDARPMVGLAFREAGALSALLAEGYGNPGSSPRPLAHVVMVQISSNFFAYRPVLGCLQSMASVPLADELVHGKPPAEAPAIGGGRSFDALAESAAVAASLDGSQRLALQQALSQRVSVIQGPPGTGKTYIGVQLARLLHDHTSGKILVVCYTNHALDSFLESLLDAGIKGIVRIGGRSKSARLEPYNIRALARAGGAAMARADSARYGVLCRRIEALQEEIDRLAVRLQHTTIGAAWWDRAGPFLREYYPGTAEQLRVSAGDITDADGMTRVGANNRKLAADFLWKAWIKGAGPGPLAAQTRAAAMADGAGENVWALSKAARLARVEAWSREMFAERRERLAELLTEAGEVDAEIQELQHASWRGVLAAARVVGATTTGAAQHRELLSEARPATVLVEEAGEVLEAHVLASVTPATTRLVLIGDHKQLRPKVESYQLSVASDRGHDLNRSLFERLVLRGFPHATLATQHRMRPEISALHRGTYPELADHPSVRAHPPLRGVARTIAFVDHRVSEDAARPGWRDAGASHTSAHEVGVAVATVRYLVQQGYQPSQMVVLTPYLGQLLELRNALAAEWSVRMQEQDVQELRRAATQQALAGVQLEGAGAGDDEASSASAGASPAGASKPECVRVSTIDNYQGEEADVVLLSLVRSNAAGSIGFLREPERVTVALSRARHGMIIFGNSDTLRHCTSGPGRQLWGQVMDQLESGGYVSSGLPAVCQRHPRRGPINLGSPAAFAEHAPHGGCTLPCDVMLQCGHVCPRKCHAFDAGHTAVACAEEVLEVCTAGTHLVRRVCSSAMPACPVCTELQRLRDEQAAARRRRVEAEAARQSRLQLERVQLELETAATAAELKALNERQADELETARREIEARKLRAEVELKQQYGPREVRELIDGAAREAEAAIAARAAQAAQEAARGRATLESAAGRAVALEAAAEADLQAIANMAVQADARLEQARAAAARKADAEQWNLANSVLWRQALREVRSTDGRAALRARVADAGVSRAAADLGDVFEDRAMGTLLATAAAARPAASEPADDDVLARGLRHASRGEWLEAYDAFAALQPATPASHGLHALCLWKLDEEAKAVAAHLAAASAEQAEHPCHAAAQAMLADRQSQPLLACGHAIATLLRCDRDRGGEDGGACPILGLAAQLAGEVLERHFARLVPEAVAGSQLERLAAAAAAHVAPEDRWKAKAAGSRALGGLLQLTGLRPVKAQFFEIADRVRLDQERGRDIKDAQYSCLFYGNPGTGKTTVARLYAQLLRELGVLPTPPPPPSPKPQLPASMIFMGAPPPPAPPPVPAVCVVETSGAKLAAGGLAELKKELDKLKDGGLLFIDEAYQLKPASSRLGAEVLDYLLPEMENRRGQLVVVMAGYKKPMEELLAYNEGFASRFPTEFTFPDYAEGELLKILLDLISQDAQAVKFRLEDQRWARIAARRLARQAGAPGFGNARAVRNLLEASRGRQAARVIAAAERGQAADPLLLMRDDLLGPREIAPDSVALRELAAMQGLPMVKAAVQRLLGVIRSNVEAEEQERPVRELSLNRVLLGNPGVGKTTVAKIYGRILRDLGLLSKGDVEVRTPADFIGQAVGTSEARTKAILDATIGCVLVIDEAYGLCPEGVRNPYTDSVIDTIVAVVQGVPGDDRCVLLLGYEEPMQRMMREANPGLARRFRMEDAWRFEDYGDEDLLRILRARAAKLGLSLDLPTAREAVAVLARERMKPNFGNAGAVNNLLARASERQEARQMAAGLTAAERAADRVLIPADFLREEDGSGGPVDLDALFADLVGCGGILAKLRELQATVAAARDCGLDPLSQLELNFCFVGAPGVGKTTVARRVGKLFESLGLLASSEVIDVSANEFTTGYVGQSSGATRRIFEKALGKVLFVDEAYRLHPSLGGPYMREALDEMVQLLTEPKFKGKLVLIFAGYPQQIDELLQVNPGLRSRMSNTLVFEDLTPVAAAELLQATLRAKSARLAAGAEAALPALLARLIASPGWSNGRTLHNWGLKLFAAAAVRRQSEAQQQRADPSRTAPLARPRPSASGLVIEEEDLRCTMEALIRPVPAAGASQPAGSIGAAPAFEFATASARQEAPPPLAMVQEHTITVEQAPPAERQEEEMEKFAQQAADRDGPEAKSFFDAALTPAFLTQLQDALTAAGRFADVAATAADGQLAQNAALVSDVATASGYDGDVVVDLIQKWQKGMLSSLEYDQQLRLQSITPIWHCSAGCNRRLYPPPGQPWCVGPYIRGYERVDIGSVAQGRTVGMGAK